MTSTRPHPSARRGKQKEKLRPCQDVVMQLRWDARFRESDYVLGYEERFAGIREVPLIDFLDESEIPWHRIRYVRFQQQLVWDREQRIDLIVSGEHTGPALDTPSCTASSSDFSASFEQVVFQVEPVTRSALVVLPPEDMWEPIQSIRKEYDRSFQRWMPHINLIYGFVPDSLFSQAADAIRLVTRDVEPFSVSLSSFGLFRHKKSSTVWLDPVPSVSRGLRSLQASLEPLFPLCDQQSSRGARGFTPHLTVASFQRQHKDDAEGHMRAWQEAWAPMSFPVGDVVLISRKGDEPFEVRERVALGSVTSVHVSGVDMAVASPLAQPVEDTKEAEEQVLWDARVETAQSNLNRLFQAISGDWWEGHVSLLGETNESIDGLYPGLWLYGSRWLGVHQPDSDIDVLCVVPECVDLWDCLEAWEQALRRESSISELRLVREAFVPGLKWVEDGVLIELSCVCVPEEWMGLPLASLGERIDELDIRSQRALRGRLEAELLLNAVEQGGCKEAFLSLLTVVKRWARARDVDQNALGTLGGFSWALLAAWSCLSVDEEQDKESHLLGFFEQLVEYPEGEPIVLPSMPGGLSFHPRKDRFPVVCPLPPFANSARNVTSSSLAVLREEWTRAVDILWKDGAFDSLVRELCRPVSFREEAQNGVCLSVRLVPEGGSKGGTEESACRGWMLGQMAGLLLDAERALSSSIRIFSAGKEEQGVVAHWVVWEASRQSVDSWKKAAEARWQRLLTRAYPGWSMVLEFDE